MRNIAHHDKFRILGNPQKITRRGGLVYKIMRIFDVRPYGLKWNLFSIKELEGTSI